jgi:transcription antitermination factor NusG
MEGNVKVILEQVGKVQVELTIFGRPVAVDLEYYQVEQA